jgi:DNA-binding protein H-NS
MSPLNIKSLSVPQLLALRDDIDERLQAHRAELQAQLAQIKCANGKSRAARGGRVRPKYRHPQTGETWSGRGDMAAWLAREISAGGKREDFLIDRSPGRRGEAN